MDRTPHFKKWNLLVAQYEIIWNPESDFLFTLQTKISGPSGMLSSKTRKSRLLIEPRKSEIQNLAAKNMPNG